MPTHVRSRLRRLGWHAEAIPVGDLAAAAISQRDVLVPAENARAVLLGTGAIIIAANMTDTQNPLLCARVVSRCPLAALQWGQRFFRFMHDQGRRQMATPKHLRDMTEAELARHVATRPASTSAPEWDEISIERIRRSIAAYDAGEETATAAMWDIAHEANLFMTRGLPRLLAESVRRGGDSRDYGAVS